MKIKTAIYFCSDDGERFFGEGPYRLLKGIQTTGSLRSAAQQMGIAYTKAFSILKRAETEFGFALTQRQIGGKGGGGSVLTEQAKQLVESYEQYKSACQQQSRAEYQHYFQQPYFPSQVE